MKDGKDIPGERKVCWSKKVESMFKQSKQTKLVRAKVLQYLSKEWEYVNI